MLRSRALLGCADVCSRVQNGALCSEGRLCSLMLKARSLIQREESLVITGSLLQLTQTAVRPPVAATDWVPMFWTSLGTHWILSHHTDTLVFYSDAVVEAFCDIEQTSAVVGDTIAATHRLVQDVAVLVATFVFLTDSVFGHSNGPLAISGTTTVGSVQNALVVIRATVGTTNWLVDLGAPLITAAAGGGGGGWREGRLRWLPIAYTR